MYRKNSEHIIIYPEKLLDYRPVGRRTGRPLETTRRLQWWGWNRPFIDL